MDFIENKKQYHTKISSASFILIKHGETEGNLQDMTALLVSVNFVYRARYLFNSGNKKPGKDFFK